MDEIPKNITFVTAFINIYETQFEDKSIEWRFNKFREIAETGIHICIFISPDVYYYFIDNLSNYENIRLIKVLNIKDTDVYKLINNTNVSLPTNRNQPKD